MTESFDSLNAALADRYQIDRELGRGGMAVVFLARDRRHDRLVAIKTLLPELATAVGHERFLAEIRTAAQLHHPHILPLFDSGEAGGILYYVMPYVAGESLRDRLERERQLPIDEAVRIGREVADALAFAHEQGIVHRDIKPENILLADGHAVVADFGLARAVYRAASPKLTASGIVLGTPMYMSPEQASGEREVDGRSDIYSLGCVVFELIAGVPPFRGATPQVLLSKHVSEEPPPLCGERRTCPPQVDGAVRRALAKAPADRFRSAREFAEALGRFTPPDGGTPPPPPPPPRKWWQRPAAALAALAVLAALVGFGVWGVRRLRTPPPDESRYVVLPFTASGWNGEAAGGAGGGTDGAAVAERLADALGEWRGVSVVEERLVREALGTPARLAALRTPEAAALARKLGAGRLVWGELRRGGDTLYVMASVVATAGGGGGREVRQAPAALLPPGNDVMAYRSLANTLLRDGTELPWTGPTDRHKPSLEAWLTYDRGRAALETWDLTAAAAAFRRAVAAQPDHAHANLWLSQVLLWADSPTSLRDPKLVDEARASARRAVELRSRLRARDAAIAEALLALAEGQYPEACEQFRDADSAAPGDFVVQFGLGDCQSRDSVVVATTHSQSGYAFRGSSHSAAQSYLRALERLTGVHPNFVYLRLSGVLQTETSTRPRLGYPEGGGVRFVAYPSLAGDTIAYVPYPERELAAGRAGVIPPTLGRAIERNRQVLLDAFVTWTRASPRSALAHEHLARLLEVMPGTGLTATASGPSALEEIRRARELAADSSERLRLMQAEVRLLLKTMQLKLARDAADSLLRVWRRPAPAEADRLVGLAALTGHPRRAAELLRTLVGTPKYSFIGPDGRPIAVPAEVAADGLEALAYAAVGACPPNLRALAQRLERTLESHDPDSTRRAQARDVISRRPLSLAVPCLGPEAVTGLDARGDRLLGMQQALARGDTASVRAAFDTLRALRRYDRPGDISIDYTYQEAWLLAEVGDTAGATRHLDLTLGAPTTLGTPLLALPERAGGLVRAMALRAELASRRGDAATAGRWAEAVLALWGGADPEMSPQVDRMREIVRTRPPEAGKKR